MERNLVKNINSWNQFLFDLVLVALSSGMFTYGLHGAFHNITLAFFLGAVFVNFILYKKFEAFIPWPIIALQAAVLAVYTFHSLFIHGWDSDVAHLISNKSSIVAFAILFTFMPFRTKKAYGIIFLFTFLWLDMESIGALINYYKDVTETKIYTWSSVIHVSLIPFSIMHHHLSVCVAFGIALAIYLLFYTTLFQSKLSKGILIIQILYFFLFANILAARIGLILTYLSLVVGLFIFIFKFAPFPKTISLIALLVLIGGFSYFSTKMPTLHKKISETFQDIESIKNEGLSTRYNISGRLFSYRLTWNMFKKNPMGTGYLEFENKTKEEYEKYHPEIPVDQWVICPNQYLKYLACFGLPVCILFWLCFIGPSLYFLRSKFILYFTLVFFTMTYFITEYPLDNINFYYFFAFYSSLLLHFHLSQKTEKST